MDSWHVSFRYVDCWKIPQTVLTNFEFIAQWNILTSPSANFLLGVCKVFSSRVFKSFLAGNLYEMYAVKVHLGDQNKMKAVFCNGFVIYAIRMLSPFVSWITVAGLALIYLRFSLPFNITCCSERVIHIRRQRIPSTNASKRNNFQCFAAESIAIVIIFKLISSSSWHLDFRSTK